jgi:hypothetical protein
MDMQVAPHVRQAHEAGQLIGPGERDLAAVFAQLRRNEGKAKLLVDLFLGCAGDAAPAGKQTVFIELPATVDARARKAMLRAFDPVK